MAISKFNYNSFNVTPVAGAALAFDADADGFSTATATSMVLIKTLTASSSSTLSFVNGSSDVVLDNTYPVYKFVWINCHPSQQSGDGEEFQFNLSVDTGSNYNVAKTSTYFIATHAENGTSSSFSYTDGHDLAQSTGVQKVSVDNDADDDASNSGSMFLFNPSSTTFVKHYIVENNYMHSSPLTINTHIAGYANTTSAIDAIKFEFSAGTIQSGTIKLYGIKDS